MVWSRFSASAVATIMVCVSSMVENDVTIERLMASVSVESSVSAPIARRDCDPDMIFQLFARVIQRGMLKFDAKR